MQTWQCNEKHTRLRGRKGRGFTSLLSTQCVGYSSELQTKSESHPGLGAVVTNGWCLISYGGYTRLALSFILCKLSTLANCEDADELSFYQGLHCLCRQKIIFRKSHTILFGHKLWPTNYTIWIIQSSLHQTKRINSSVHNGL